MVVGNKIFTFGLLFVLLTTFDLVSNNKIKSTALSEQEETHHLGFSYRRKYNIQ
jgi:hypothetical protein